MFGLIGKISVTDGNRENFVEILLDGTKIMPGCLSYVIGKDLTDLNAVWVTEVWDDQDSHAASLKLPSVQAAIAKGRAMISSMDVIAKTEPVGGHGL